MKIPDEQTIHQALLERGLLTQDELARAWKERTDSETPFEAVLVDIGLVAEGTLRELVSELMGIPFLRLKGSAIDPEALRAVPARYANHYRLMPVKLEDSVLTVALSDPEDVLKLDEIQLALKHELRPVLATGKEVAEAIQTHYGVGAEILEKLTGQPSAVAVEEKASEAAPETEEPSVVKFVNQLIRDAYLRRATDVHLEPFKDQLQVRHRVDGVLYETRIPSSILRFREAIVSRIKIMASLDIAEKMLPQDGRFRVRMEGRDLDIRLATVPTPYGESVTLRLLSGLQLVKIDGIGFEERDLEILRPLIRRPHGMILLTGPTGSGKSTTLYAFLREINKTERKILTIEDPIEYEMRGITQIQVQPKVGLTFARGLRSMLRHDPDVMMVGEIRDFETAEVAIRVALTGHLVFSTLHTNDAPGAVTRLLDIGVEPYLVASCIHAVIAQRLVRLICPDCKTAAKPSAQELRGLGMRKPKAKLYRGAGCEKCNGTGYRGRTSIYEMMALDAALRELVMKRSPANLLKEESVKKGMRTLRQSGWAKAVQGVTTVEEVLRVTQAAELDL
ncbi:MAG: GspE/PulE family protein [Elusimicrobiota bacterium]